jgi:hypothetical protein
MRRLAIVASAILAASLVAPSRAQEKKKDPAQVMKSLEQMVKEYQDENAALKDRVKDLEQQVQTLKQSRTVTLVPQPGAAGQVPPTWKPFQFNGATYYVVPLATDQQPAAASGARTAEQRLLIDRQLHDPAGH